MTNTVKQLVTLVPLTLILVGLLSYNFMSAQWTGPTATAPGNNTDAPINTGSTTQDKSGYLGLTGLVAYDGNITISNSAPTLLFRDMDGHRDWWQHANDNRMYFVADRNNSETWDAGDTWPHPMEMFAGATQSNDYVRFSNQVRANSYCNPDGTVCTAAGGGLGVGQTYKQYSTAQRNRSIWYQNTTASPIWVSITTNAGASVLWYSFNGSPAIQIANQDGDSGTFDNLYAVIPVGGWYQQTGSVPAVWIELSAP